MGPVRAQSRLGGQVEAAAAARRVRGGGGGGARKWRRAGLRRRQPAELSSGTMGSAFGGPRRREDLCGAHFVFNVALAFAWRGQDPFVPAPPPVDRLLPFRSVPFHSVSFRFVPFRSVPFRSLAAAEAAQSNCHPKLELRLDRAAESGRPLWLSRAQEPAGRPASPAAATTSRGPGSGSRPGRASPIRHKLEQSARFAAAAAPTWLARVWPDSGSLAFKSNRVD